MDRKLVGLISISAFFATVLAGTSVATGVNQYTLGAVNPNGYCHGAFANTNGNFSWVSAYAQQGGIGSATGPSNRAACGLNPVWGS